MRYVAAYLLAGLGGNSAPSAADIKKILSSVGVEADDSKLNALLKELEGKDIADVIKSGKEKLASVPSGAAAAAAPAAAAPAAAAAAPAKGGKEAKKEEPEEEEEVGFDLFD